MKFKVGDVVKYIGVTSPRLGFGVVNCPPIYKHSNHTVAFVDRIDSHGLIILHIPNSTDRQAVDVNKVVLLSEWRKEQKARIKASKDSNAKYALSAGFKWDPVHKLWYFPSPPFRKPNVEPAVSYFYTDIDGSSRKGLYVEPNNYGDVTITGSSGSVDWDEAVKGLINGSGITGKAPYLPTNQSKSDKAAESGETRQNAEEEKDILDITRRMFG